MADFDDLKNDPNLTEEKVQAKLNSYAKALRQEFEQATADQPESVHEYAQDFFKKNIHAAAAQIVWLSNNSTSDGIRLAAAKYVVEQALKDAKRDGDPIKDLLASLKNKTPQTDSSSNPTS
jgi:hypothetical protein